MRSRQGSAKVALLLPLTGPAAMAAVARALKQAGELAMFEAGNQPVQLLVKDDGGTPEGAARAAEEALKDGAELVLGPLGAASVQAVAPVVRRANVPAIAFSNDRRAGGAGVFLFGMMPEQEIERIVVFAAGRGKRSFAALLQDDAYGQVAEAAFLQAVGKVRGNVLAVERTKGGVAGLLEPVQRIGEAVARSGGSEDIAIFVPGSQDLLSGLGSMLTYAKLDQHKAQLLGDSGWEATQAGREKVLLGAWYAGPDPKGWQAFGEKYARTFGTVPPRIASLGFDAVAIAVVLAGLPPGSRYTPANLTRASGFSGVDGVVRLMPDGTARRALAVIEMQGFGANVIDPPADAAEGPAQAARPAVAEAAAAVPPIR